MKMGNSKIEFLTLELIRIIGNLVYIDFDTVLIEMRKFENQYVIFNYQRMSGSKNEMFSIFE